MATRPLIETKVLTEFGEVYEDASFYETTGSNADHSYVPGYSDMRRARDLAIARVQAEFKGSSNEAAKEAALRKIPPLDVRCQWVRSVRVAGNEPDTTKETQADRHCCRACEKWESRSGGVDT